MKQCTILKAKCFFSLQNKKGRPAMIGIGDRFMVTSPEHMNKETVVFGREKKAQLNQGYRLTVAQINQLFEVVK